MMGCVGPVARQPTSVGFVEQYAVAAGRFADAVADSDMRAGVPSCPGWSTYDLVVHLGNVHAWAATVVETRRPAADQSDQPRSSRARVVSGWYAAKAEDLYQVLRCVVPDQPCWTFVEREGVAGFWARRQLHETTVHLVDLDAACGRGTELDPAVCADGVEEVLGTMLRRMHHRGHPARLTERLRVECVDTGDRWLLTPQPQAPPALTRCRGEVAGEADGSADVVSARAETLYRLLWHRAVSAGELRVDGDQARVQAFLASRLTP
jgi:uncharacterized protein (TIGR03083 family)